MLQLAARPAVGLAAQLVQKSRGGDWNSDWGDVRRWGAAPGAAIGGLVGGLIGSIGGAVGGRWLGEQAES